MSRLVYNGEHPRWRHVHDCCRFLGQFGNADLWGCEFDKTHMYVFGEPVFMARYSDESSDYTSNLPRDPRVPEVEAKRRWYAMNNKPETKTETHDITYLMNVAWNCGCRWGREAGGGNTSGQDEQRVADVKRLLALENCHGEPSPTEVEDRRCGTCANNDPDVTVCGWQMRCRAGIQVPFSIYQADDGPPWLNCRFWKERS